MEVCSALVTNVAELPPKYAVRTSVIVCNCIDKKAHPKVVPAEKALNPIVRGLFSAKYPEYLAKTASWVQDLRYARPVRGLPVANMINLAAKVAALEDALR